MGPGPHVCGAPGLLGSSGWLVPGCLARGCSALCRCLEPASCRDRGLQRMHQAPPAAGAAHQPAVRAPPQLPATGAPPGALRSGRGAESLPFRSQQSRWQEQATQLLWLCKAPPPRMAGTVGGRRMRPWAWWLSRGFLGHMRPVCLLLDWSCHRAQRLRRAAESWRKLHHSQASGLPVQLLCMRSWTDQGQIHMRPSFRRHARRPPQYRPGYVLPLTRRPGRPRSRQCRRGRPPRDPPPPPPQQRQQPLQLPPRRVSRSRPSLPLLWRRRQQWRCRLCLRRRLLLQRRPLMPLVPAPPPRQSHRCYRLLLLPPLLQQQ
mmetsp:Transcript_19586/g.59250  ORF Transcript_19586/g.59250 Transcript_19586/m.59250 type:complete len:318 (+) Transcript_19586:2093-3046(+)